MKRAASENAGMKRALSASARGRALRTLSGNGLNKDGKLTGIFNNLTVTVLGSKGISNMRKEIIEHAVASLGGNVVPIAQVSTLVSCKGQQETLPENKVNRIIVRDGSMGDAKFLSLIKMMKVSCPDCNKLHVTLVEPDIIQECVRTKTLPASCTTPSSEQQQSRLLWGEAACEPETQGSDSTEIECLRRKRTCSGSSSADERSNRKLVEALSRLADHMKYVGDEHRSRAYKRAADAVARHEGWIRRVEPQKGLVISQDACGKQFQSRIHGVGRSSLKQMKEFLEGDGSSFLLRTLDESESIPVLKELMLVWGVGQATAITLHRVHKIRSWVELRDKAKSIANVLPRPEAVPMMLTFLDFFEDLHEKDPATGEYSLRRVPRAEIEQLGELVQKEINAMSGLPLRVHCCGSYRRGKKDSGDIDILLEATCDVGYEYRLDTVVDNLRLKGMVKHLVRPSDTHFWQDIHRAKKAQGEFGLWSPIRSYMGFIRLSQDSPWRRIDMWMYTEPATVPYGLLQYTGSKHFNCSMRLFAKRKGYVLNSTGLYHGRDSRADGKLVASEPVAGSREVTCEADIFRLLGLHYVEPCERDGGHPTMTWGGVQPSKHDNWQTFGEDDSDGEDDFGFTSP